ncbi:hypothetical protein PQX77_012113 [Marasmius sp. AFHP31]|nr:hypothetical protein PQX77_012113 [Marasmius sp. AFHP31]
MQQHDPEIPVIHLSHHYLRPSTGYSNMSAIGNYPAFELQYSGGTTAGANTIHNFSEGFPSLHYPDHGYHCVLDSGEISSSASLSPPQHATGVTNPDNLASPFSDLYPADVSPYQHLWPSSSAHTLDSSLSLLDSDPGPFPHKSSPPSSRYPSNTLTTPSEMAIIMNTTAERVNSPCRAPPPPAEIAVNEQEGVSPPFLEAETAVPRERRHACSMCHKRFDRPSTLRKHLLVHTGEKGNCDTCGRRFGVASNLNRHVRRCILKPVNALSLDNSSSPEAEPRRTQNRTPHSPDDFDAQTDKQLLGVTTTATAINARSFSTQKRRRRAPSPSRWIPNSLSNFNLEGAQKTVVVPLPPVSPSEWEERNSYDENVGTSPYHPREWQYKPWLPGPGLVSGLGFGGRGMRGFGMGGGRGQTFGSLLVF